MSDNFVKKNIRLSQEFDNYVSGRPTMINKIPNRGVVYITVKGDEIFNRRSRSLAVEGTRERRKIVEARKNGRSWTILPYVPA